MTRFTRVSASLAPPSSSAVRRFLSLWGPVIVYMALIHTESSMSNPPEPPGISDKVLHFGAFGGLALLSLRALAGATWRGVKPWTLIGCVMITLLYGVKDEWHQMYTPGRTSDVMDVAADLSGGLVVAIVAGAWSIIRRL